jgi:ornithine carbamoyltransferase
MPRHFLKLSDLGSDGLLAMLDLADRWKAVRGRPEAEKPLAGKSVALIFEKASTRTRVSLEVAVHELGGHPVVVTTQGSQLARGEPIEDTARVFSRMVHAVALRTYSEARISGFAAHSTVPVLNALTDQSHPMQLLADLQTVREKHGTLAGLKYAWVGDGNNMANSWMEAAGLLRLSLSIACPPGYDPDENDLRIARERGASIEIVRDPRQAVRGAHVVSTDVFASMGQEAEQTERLRAFSRMRVTKELMDLAASNAIVLHCLPAHRGEEIDADVIDGPRSVVWDQAEARLHTSKAVLAWAVGGDD